ncbi:MAG: Bcr/CflA family drug resistance efflux transporter, partial [Rhizobiales bacterium]|nr:Bcr/CflA family drug resistance efflux transporter [Hyphomicrobiales bacterium]
LSHGGFLPFLGSMSVFLLGMGIVNPLGTAQALSPFGANAGAASALLGFWQMLGAAFGVWMAATIVGDAMIALGIVLALGSTLALILYQLRARAPVA